MLWSPKVYVLTFSVHYISLQTGTKDAQSAVRDFDRGRIGGAWYMKMEGTPWGKPSYSHPAGILPLFDRNSPHTRL